MRCQLEGNNWNKNSSNLCLVERKNEHLLNFSAPVPPKNLSITEPESALRTIRLTFDPPSQGKIGGFLIEVEEVEDANGARRKRSLNGGILEDSQVELPLKVDQNETSVELTFASYGSVYSVTLRSLSPNQKPSLASANQNIMTGRFFLTIL